MHELQPSGWDGGAEGDRTPDLVNAIHALYQLSYDPNPTGRAIYGKGRARSKLFSANPRICEHGAIRVGHNCAADLPPQSARVRLPGVRACMKTPGVVGRGSCRASATAAMFLPDGSAGASPYHTRRFHTHSKLESTKDMLTDDDAHGLQ